MANQVLNSTYGVNYNISGTSATIGPYSGNLYFNEDSSYTFNNCMYLNMNLQELVNNVSMNKVVNASWMYLYCTSLTGYPVISNSITDASYMYYYCTNLTGSPVVSNSITNAASMYQNCINLTGFPVVSNSITNASNMYSDCYNLTGSPVVSNSITDAASMYSYCDNLTGSPVVSNSITNATGMYYHCSNLTGYPVVSDSIINAGAMYSSCTNLTGSGNVYMNNVNYCYTMLYGRPTTAGRINLFINPSKLNIKNSSNRASNILKLNLTWTDMTDGYYNTQYNIYVYTNAT